VSVQIMLRPLRDTPFQCLVILLQDDIPVREITSVRLVILVHWKGIV
jgi:hypothetical protein